MEREVIKSIKYIEDRPKWVYNLETRNKNYFVNGILTHNSPYVILDEAALVDDVIESKVFRMIAGFSTTKHLYLKVGNPFYRNHFLKSHNDPDFHLIHFDWRKGVEEGRFSQEIIDKSRSKPGFNVLYDVKFPDADAIDDKGWSWLLTEKDIEDVMVENGSGFGFLKVGIDPAGEGKNFNVAVKRYRNYASIILKERVMDQFVLTERIMNWKNQLKNSEGIMPMGYWVDKIGVGEGYYQTLRQDLENVWGVNVGMSAISDNFVNLKAEAYWKLRDDIKTKRLHLEKNEDWFQLAQIKYRTKLEGKKGKIEIMGKEEMRANGIESPDIAEALMLTYTQPDPIDTVYSTSYNETKEDNNYEKFSPIYQLD